MKTKTDQEQVEFSQAEIDYLLDRGPKPQHVPQRDVQGEDEILHDPLSSLIAVAVFGIIIALLVWAW